MYETFYRLREKPFSLTPNPEFLYPSRHHQFAAMMLEYGIVNQAGFFLLTGEVGSGKTLLIRQLLSRIDTATTVGLISNTNRNLGRLLQWVSMAFDLPYRGKDDAELYEQFADFLIAEYAAGRRVLLIVDEAQNLDAPMLEEVRVLSNVNVDQHLVLQTLLVGQPELRATLQRRDLRQLAQRIGIDYHLPALTVEETRNYVRHRLRIAGGAADLIDDEAIDVAFKYSGGVPRLINQLCDLALVYGFAEQISRIDSEIMLQVIADRSRGGLLPLPARDESRPTIGA
jgi:type II secretory pathway predicted ATPase ExeA